jgi:hypothetical protein
MDCPYCLEAIHDDASRCPHCRSEVGVFRPLLRHLDHLQARVAALEARTAPQATAQAAATRPHATDAGVAVNPPTPALPVKPAYLVVRGAWTVALLGCLHLLLLFVLDANPLSLRVATLLVSLAAGFLTLRRHALRPRYRVVFSAGVGAGAVALMLAITAALDDVSFWPADGREWRETIEYALGITLSHLAGGLSPWSWRRARSWHRARMAERLSSIGAAAVPLTGWRAVAARWLAGVRQVAFIIAPVASCATAFYSGLRIFLGA